MDAVPCLSTATFASRGIGGNVLLAHVTAYYGLCELAKLRAGERVLIHTASGGVGLCAIRLAQHLGAEIFATAGTETKRCAPRAGSPSRLRFPNGFLCIADFGADPKRRRRCRPQYTVWTALDRSLSLRSDGRFVDLTKRDHLQRWALSLSPFCAGSATSWSICTDFCCACLQRIQNAISDVFSLLQQGVFTALPTESVPWLIPESILRHEPRPAHGKARSAHACRKVDSTNHATQHSIRRNVPHHGWPGRTWTFAPPTGFHCRGRASACHQSTPSEHGCAKSPRFRR